MHCSCFLIFIFVLSLAVAHAWTHTTNLCKTASTFCLQTVIHAGECMWLHREWMTFSVAVHILVKWPVYYFKAKVLHQKIVQTQQALAGCGDTEMNAGTGQLGIITRLRWMWLRVRITVAKILPNLGFAWSRPKCLHSGSVWFLRVNTALPCWEAVCSLM